MQLPIDLRSDTVTRPTPKMREAMARAAVGDDVFGEDPTLIELEERVAALLGKERALFVPSGTMANQIALSVQTSPGDEVLASMGAHCLWYESGAGAGVSGVQLRELGERSGLFRASDVETALPPPGAYYMAATRMVAIENSHNRGGGRIFPQTEALAIAKVARDHGLGLHLDGARLWNVHIATGLPLAELAAPFDTVSVCLSKGLGAPVGSLLAGSQSLLTRAHRRRKMLGGGMRQAGILAAAGLYALDHHVARLAEDHLNARTLAESIAGLPGVEFDPKTVETNIVIWDLAPDFPEDAAQLVARAKEKGVLLSAMGPRRVRAVTHLDVDGAACTRAAQTIREVLASA